MALPEKCPLCKADRSKQTVVTSHVYGGKFGSRNHSFFHCDICDIRYQYPGLTQEEEAHFYAAEFEGFMASRSGTKGGWEKTEDHILANEPTRVRRMKYLGPQIEGKMKILEVGCSSGFMLFPLISSGFSCSGIEPSGVFSEFIRNRGLTVYESLDLMKKSVPDIKYDIIMHFFVLEHIAEPFEFLDIQLELLQPGGKIIFEIPNAADPLYSVYDIPAFERFYWSIAHPWYFSQTSLKYLLEKIGQPYEIMLDQRYDLSNHMVWARDGKPGGLGRFTDLLGSDLEEIYKEELIKRGYCDTLIAVITKK